MSAKSGYWYYPGSVTECTPPEWVPEEEDSDGPELDYDEYAEPPEWLEADKETGER